MKLRSTKISFAVLAGLSIPAASSILTTRALAASPAEERIDLDQQQGLLNERLGHLDRVSQIEGRYVLLRDTYFYGANGVSQLAQAWHLKAHAWVADWQKLLAFFDDTSSSTLSRADVQDGIRTKLRAQEDAWASLKRDAVVIRSRLTDGRRELAKLERLPVSYVADYGSQLGLLNSQLDALDAAFGKAEAAFNNDESAAWDTLTASTQTAVLNRLRKAALQYPDLSQAVARVDQLFQAERTLGAFTRGVEGKFDTLRDELLRHRIFHAIDALAALQTESTSATAGVDAAGLDPEFSGPAREDITRMLTAGQGLFSDATRSFTNAALVATFAGAESRRLAALCRDGDARKDVNCDLLRTLLPIPATEILKMTDAQLRNLEFTYEKAASSPL